MLAVAVAEGNLLTPFGVNKRRKSTCQAITCLLNTSSKPKVIGEGSITFKCGLYNRRP